MLNRIKLFFNQDIETLLHKIKPSPVAQKAFLWTFILVNIVFLWHTLAFLPDNHSWELLKQGVSIDFQFSDHNGRFSSGVIQQLLGGNILPVVNSVFCYCGFVVGMILLASYWQLPKTVLLYTLFSLFVILLPYTLPWVYFVRHNTYFWSICLAICGLHLSLKGKILHSILAIVLFVFSMGSYISMVQIILVVFLGRCLLDNLQQNLSLSQLFSRYWKTAACIVCSVIAFMLIMLYLKSIGLLGSQSQTELAVPYQMKHIKSLIESFVTEMPYISSWFKIMLLFPLLCTLIYCYIKDRYFSLLLIFAILVSAQLTNILSKHDFLHTVRVMFFTFPWIYILFLTILIKWGNIWKNIAIILMFVSIWYSVLQDLRWQKSFVAESQIEIQTYFDISHRIKMHPNFKPNKKYKLVMLGIYDVKGLFTPNYKKWDGNNHYINSTLNPFWQPYQLLNFWEKTPYINRSFHATERILGQIKLDELRKMDIEFLMNKAKPYPNKNSVSVDNDFIYIIFDKDILSKLQKKIKSMNSSG